MKLIPRRTPKKDPTPIERAAGYAKLAGHGLTAQRVARKGVRRYRLGKRLLALTGLAAAGAFIAKKARGGSDTSTVPPMPTAAPSGAPAGTSGTAAATAATGTSPATSTDTPSGPEVPDALADAGVEGGGPDTPKEAAAPGVGDESGTSGNGSGDIPPADASGTDDTLQVEAPNQSTPPPPDRVTKN